MATTTNFGWTTPDDTALVKDGASAIRTLGSSIDTSMAQLKGGTTGQILSKTSNSDMAFTWINNDQGDITAVTAGTGISGGGTTGAVTITNSMATTIDAKGDLIAGTGDDAFARLAVGTNGQYLSADSTTSTGLKWVAAPSSSGPAFKATGTSSQSLTSSAWVKAQLGTETFDTDGCYDNATNFRFTPNKAGYYQFQTAARITHGDATAYYQYGIYKNGALENLMALVTNATNGQTMSASNLIYFNGSTDYAEFYVYTQGSSANLDRSSSYFSGVWIRS